MNSGQTLNFSAVNQTITAVIGMLQEVLGLIFGTPVLAVPIGTALVGSLAGLGIGLVRRVLAARKSGS